jgi:hypothetical protein
MAEDVTPALLKAPDAFGRLSVEQGQETEAYTLGVQAVLWGMQWVKAGEAFRLFTRPLPEGAQPSPLDPMPHVVNVWGHARQLLDADTRLIETPNTGTLYSIIVIDLAVGPVVVEHPDVAGRYYRSTIWDLHSDTHTISELHDGDAPPPCVIVRTGWSGALPDGVRVIEVRSRYLQVAPHIAVTGPDDLDAVHELQAGLRVIRLDQWGSTNEALAEGEPMRPIRRPGTLTPEDLLFFEELGETLKDLTIRNDEVAFARQLGQIGITLDGGFRFDGLDEGTVAGLRLAVLDGQTLAAHKARDLLPLQPGGTWSGGGDMTGLDDWWHRAGVGFGYVWADLGSEEPLTGAKRYVLRFRPGGMPPGRYWRISMYDLEGFFADNLADRYGIGNMADDLRPRRRRRPHDPHPARLSRRRRGHQLAAVTRCGLHPRHAPLPARRSHDPRRLPAPACEADDMTQILCARCCNDHTLPRVRRTR